MVADLPLSGQLIRDQFFLPDDRQVHAVSREALDHPAVSGWVPGIFEIIEGGPLPEQWPGKCSARKSFGIDIELI